MPKAKTADTDLVHAITYGRSERLDTFRSLSVPERAAVFEKLSPYIQQSLLKELKLHETVDIIDHLDMQHAQHVLKRIPNAKRRDTILRRLKGEVK